jgi:hypothetical protein
MISALPHYHWTQRSMKTKDHGCLAGNSQVNCRWYLTICSHCVESQQYEQSYKRWTWVREHPLKRDSAGTIEESSRTLSILKAMSWISCACLRSDGQRCIESRKVLTTIARLRIEQVIVQ